MNQLNKALSLYNTGDVKGAQQLLSSLCSKRASAQTWFLMAVTYLQTNEAQRAKKAFEAALKAQPCYPDAYNNLGVLAERDGNLKGAIQYFSKAIEQKHDYTSALFNLGSVYQKSKDYPQAEHQYLRVLALEPNNINAHLNLGSMYMLTDQLESALIHLKASQALAPNDHTTLNNLGRLFHLKKEYKEAISYFHKALIHNPGFPEAHNNIALSYIEKEEIEEAKSHLNQAILLNDQFTEAITNLANLYKGLNQLDAAETYYKKALAVDPKSPSANCNIGLVMLHKGNYDSAKTYFQFALSNNENHQESRYNLGTYQLSTGDFSQGWINYLVRNTPRHPMAMNISHVRLDDLKGKQILLLRDQGLGDELFFLRFCEDLKKLDTHITYLCSPQIKSFVDSLDFVDHAIVEDPGDDQFDFLISIADLPSLFSEQSTNLARASISLTVDKRCESELKAILKSFGPPPYIGITWRAGSGDKDRLFKQLPLKEFLSQFSNLNATIISLQRLPSITDKQYIDDCATKVKVHDMSELNNDLPKMLTLLSLLDHYVGVSNTNMHLCAAINKSATVLVPHPPEWRWMLASTHSPWFPKFTLLRQAPSGSWTDVFLNLKTQVRERYGQ